MSDLITHEREHQFDSDVAAAGWLRRNGHPVTMQGGLSGWYHDDDNDGQHTLVFVDIVRDGGQVTVTETHEVAVAGSPAAWSIA